MKHVITQQNNTDHESRPWWVFVFLKGGTMKRFLKGFFTDFSVPVTYGILLAIIIFQAVLLWRMGTLEKENNFIIQTLMEVLAE